MAVEPGTYLSPLVRLQRLQGEEDHLHVDEVRLRPDGKLLQCSYTFGVVETKDPKNMNYLAQNLKHTIPNDMRRPGCVHLAWDGDIVYTTHRGNIRNPAFLTAWNIAPDAMNKITPVQLPVLQEPGVSYEGVDVANGNIYVGLHDKGLGVYRRDANNVISRIGTGTGFMNAWGIVARDQTVFVADGEGGLATVDASDPTNPRIVGRAVTGGQARGLVLNGNTAFVAAGSAGLVVVDVTNLAAPVVVGRAEMPGTAIRVDYSAGHAFVAAWNDARVFDVSQPAAPRFVAAVRLTEQIAFQEDDRDPATSRVLGIAARNNDVFIGNWHVLYSYRLHPTRVAPNIRLPEAASLVDFGPVPVGTKKAVPVEITNQGTAPLTLLNNSVEGAAFTVTPKSVRIAPGQKAALAVEYTAGKAERETGYLRILSDDPEAPVRKAFLVGNQPGVGVGAALPETGGAMLDGSQWTSSQASGKVLLLNYFATFCPVCGGQLPDIEQRFWKKYRDRGLQVVALNAHDTKDKIGEVTEYCDKLRLTFPLGLEETQTYKGLTANFKGVNPFPVDVIVSKTGQIEYISREYDPDAMTAIIERLLAE